MEVRGRLVRVRKLSMVLKPTASPRISTFKVRAFFLLGSLSPGPYFLSALLYLAVNLVEGGWLEGVGGWLLQTQAYLHNRTI